MSDKPEKSQTEGYFDLIRKMGSDLRGTTRFRCVVCGKLTSGRIPRNGRHVGDGTVRFPRRHNFEGKPCEGNIRDAEWVDIAGF